MPTSKKKKSRADVPLISMAGLIRYYEEERVKIKVNPYIILGIGLGLSVAIAVLDVVKPLP